MTPYRHALVPLDAAPPPGYLPTNLLAPSVDGEQRRIWVSTSVPDTTDHVVAMTGTVRHDRTLKALIKQICAVHGLDQKTLLDTEQRRHSIAKARRQLYVQGLALRRHDGKPVYSAASLARALDIDPTSVTHGVRKQRRLDQAKQALRIAAE